jgi:hypothetical protein
MLSAAVIQRECDNPAAVSLPLFVWSRRGSVQSRRFDREQLQIRIKGASQRSALLLLCEAFPRRPVNDVRVEMRVANFGCVTQSDDLWQRHNLQWSLKGRRFAKVTWGHLELPGHLKNPIWIDGMLRGALARRRNRC